MNVFGQVDAEETEPDDEDGEAVGETGTVVSVRPAKGRRQRCGICGRKAAKDDAGEGR